MSGQYGRIDTRRGGGERIVDLGAGRNPDDRATETVDLHFPADHQFDLSGPWELGDDSVDMLIARHVVEHLPLDHVFAEAHRVLRPGGRLEVTMPLGEDAATDPTHRNRWTWGTPLHWCDERGPEWGPESGFRLVDRHVHPKAWGPESLTLPLWEIAAVVWPGWTAARCVAGELIATFESLGDRDGH